MLQLIYGLFVGKTTKDEWTKMMEFPAPWGEIEIPSVFTITAPTQALKKVQNNIEGIAQLYERIFKLIVELMGTQKIHYHERMVFDDDLSKGK